MTEYDASPLLADGQQIPPELQSSIDRHRQHLAALVTSLRAAGVGEGVIDGAVRQLVDSYRVELTAAVRALVGEPRNV